MSSDTLEELKSVDFADKSHTQKQISELMVAGMIELLEESRKPISKQIAYLTIYGTPCGNANEPSIEDFQAEVLNALNEGYEQINEMSRIEIRKNLRGSVNMIQQTFVRKRGSKETGVPNSQIVLGHYRDREGKLQLR